MPEKKTRESARASKKKGNAASTQAGEYVKEEIHHIRSGKHGAKNAKQAIAIGLSKARKDGVKVPAKRGTKAAAKKASARKTASHGHKASGGKASGGKTSTKRSAASKKALKRQPRRAASHTALSRHAKKTASPKK